MSNPEFHACPICSAPVWHQERYPQELCHACCEKACNAQGQKLSFFNVSISGGFRAVIADTQAEHPSHICYVDGVTCWADEAYFGGIVIQPDSR